MKKVRKDVNESIFHIAPCQQAKTAIWASASVLDWFNSVCHTDLIHTL